MRLFVVQLRNDVAYVSTSVNISAPVYAYILINQACCSEGEIILLLLTHILDKCFHLHIFCGVFLILLQQEAVQTNQ